MSFKILAPSEQVAIHLRGLLLKGRWTGELPGTPTLSAELDVDRKTIMAALKTLEREGLVQPQGPGRPCLIHPPQKKPNSHLNIRLIPYESSNHQSPMILKFMNLIEESQHHISMTSSSLTELGMDVSKVARMVESNPADAWILVSASREVLQWFVDQRLPAFAVFGRRRQVPIASTGPDKVAAMRAALAKLIALGHRRIVYLVREERRIPSPGHLETEFLKSLQTHGITPGAYHLPQWQDRPDSFRECLLRLFQHTPPTALFLDVPLLYFAAQQQLAQMNIVSPRDVSLICCDHHPFFDWSRPTVAHIRWDMRAVIGQIVYWVNQLGRGIHETKPTFTHAEFIEGGTIGPVP